MKLNKKEVVFELLWPIVCFILFLLFMFIVAKLSKAADLCYTTDPNQVTTFAWDRNTEPDLAGYRLYRTQAPGDYVDAQVYEVLDPSADTYSLKVKSEGGNWFSITAIDQVGHESEFSNEVELRADFTPPTTPTGFGCSQTVNINININP